MDRQGERVMNRYRVKLELNPAVVEVVAASEEDAADDVMSNFDFVTQGDGCDGYEVELVAESVAGEDDIAPADAMREALKALADAKAALGKLAKAIPYEAPDGYTTIVARLIAAELEGQHARLDAQRRAR